MYEQQNKTKRTKDQFTLCNKRHSIVLMMVHTFTLN